MSSGYVFTKEGIREFEKERRLETISIKRKPKETREQDGIHLSVRELRSLIESTNELSLEDYVTREAKNLQPISLSLFVVNSVLWEMMAKKKRHANKMNPMITFPWFHWDKDSIAEGREAQIIRERECSGISHFKVDNNLLTIRGRAGDFAGILEKRIVGEESQRRSILTPRGIGSRDPISKYNLQEITISMNLNHCEAELYPTPDLGFDYRFSEDPKNIHLHGLRISSRGEGISLGVGRKAPAPLKGTITVFLCKSMKNLHETSIPLTYHLWMVALFELIERHSL